VLREKSDVSSIEAGGKRRPLIEAFVLAFALQAAVSLEPFGVTRTIALANLVLPYFAAVAAWSVFRQRPEVVIGWSWVIAFFLLAGLLLAHGLYVGAQHTGDVTGFGIRRTVSMALMAGYFLTGVYLASWGTWLVDRFALFFVAIAAVIAAITYVAYLLTTVGIWVDDPIFLSASKFRFIGLMDNAIPFSWLLLSAFALQIAYQTRLQDRFPKLNLVGMSFLVAALALTGAKAAWFGAVLFLIVILVFFRPLPNLRPALLAIVCGAFLTLPPVLIPVPVDAPRFLTDLGPHDMFIPSSISVREQQLGLAFDLIREFPLWGVGLGGYNWEEAIRAPVPTHYLHNSILWLWVELGPISVVLFVAFFGRVIWALWPAMSENSGGPFPSSLFALLWAFAAISLVDDVLFQRYLWVFLGAAVTVIRVRNGGSGRV
jgi:O-antigen ligase